MLKELVVTALLSGSIGLKSNVPVTTPFHDVEVADTIDFTRSPSLVQGVFNFRDSFDFTTFNTFMKDQGYVYQHETINLDLIPTGGMPIYRFAVPLSHENITWYLYELELSYYEDDYVEVYFTCYNGSQGNDLTFGFTITQDLELADLSPTFNYIKEMMFNLREGIALTGASKYIFDFLFTTLPNQFLTVYNGYFTWGSLTGYNLPVTAFGNEIASNSMWFDLATPHQNGATSWDNVYFYSVDYTSYDYWLYTLEGYSLPLQTYEKSWLVNWKMSNTTKSRLNNYGVFQYVPDHSYDDVTFRDFFFSIVDTPIYFASSLLSFELFGVNLFIALTGLMTIAIILLLIKKFW